MLVKAVDARSLAKSRPEFVRTSMLLFFNSCADDLEKTIVNLHEVREPDTVIKLLVPVHS